MRKMIALATLLLPVAAVQAQETQLVRFVACPVYRDADSGRKSGCWLAEDPATGQRWDVSLSPYKPDWNYAVLVEGRVSNAGPEACGDPVLDAVRTSRLYDMACPRHMLPAEGFPGRQYRLQGRYVDPMGVARPVPEGPFAERVFPLYFEFNEAFLVYQYDDFLIDRAVTWIAAARPERVIVTGFAATAPEVVSGVTLAEDADIARQRAEAVAVSLRRLMPDLVVEVEVSLDAQPIDDPDADGIPGQSQRRAEIRALF